LYAILKTDQSVDAWLIVWKANGDPYKGEGLLSLTRIEMTIRTSNLAAHVFGRELTGLRKEQISKLDLLGEMFLGGQGISQWVSRAQPGLSDRRGSWDELGLRRKIRLTLITGETDKHCPQCAKTTRQLATTRRRNLGRAPARPDAVSAIYAGAISTQHRLGWLSIDGFAGALRKIVYMRKLID
jgi:hypothetical protein